MLADALTKPMYSSQLWHFMTTGYLHVYNEEKTKIRIAQTPIHMDYGEDDVKNLDTVLKPEIDTMD